MGEYIFTLRANGVICDVYSDIHASDSFIYVYGDSFIFSNNSINSSVMVAGDISTIDISYFRGFRKVVMSPKNALYFHRKYNTKPIIEIKQESDYYKWLANR